MEYFSEIMGLIIVLLVLLFPFLRRLVEIRYRKKHPELFKKEQEAKEAYRKELQKRLAQEQRREWEEEQAASETHEPPQTERLVKAGYEFHTKLEKFKREDSISTRSFDTRVAPEFKKSVVSPAFLMGKKSVEKAMADKQGHLKQMVISYEILAKPKAFRSDT